MIDIDYRSRKLYITNIRIIIILILILVPSFVFGQVILTNPGIPEKETIIYTQETEGKIETVKSIIEYKSFENNSWLEYRFYSTERDVLLKLDKSNLNAYYSEVWDRPGLSSFHTIIEVLENGKQAEKDERLISDMDGFIVGLRGFTWKKNASARIVFMNRSGGFSPELKVKGKETLKIDGTSYESWKVQVGMKGVLGAVFPKSYFWYSVDSPHYLIRSEVAGLPGSPKIIMEIKSYTIN